MPPHRELNPRFQAHIARARRVRVVSVGLLVTCLLVGTGSALAMLAPQESATQSSIKNTFASVADSFGNVGSAFSRVTNSITNSFSGGRGQTAAASSDDSISNRIYRFFCPWFTDCDEPATEFTTTNTIPMPMQPRPQPQQPIVVATTTPQNTSTQRPANTGTGATTVVNNPVIEHVIERVVQGAPASLAGYVTQADLLSQIAAVKSSVGTQLYGDWYNNPGSSSNNGGIVGVIGQMGRIDSLSGTELSDITVDGVSGLTDADIPDGITASNYLLLTGGAITGDLSLSGTLTAGSLAVSGVSSGGAVEAPYFTATSTSASSTFPNLNATNATTTNATSTNMFATLGRFTSAIVDAFSAVSATITNLTSTTLVATNATTTRLDAFDYVAVGRTATTTIRGDGVASTIPYASSTAVSVSGTGFFGTASTTNFNLSGTTNLQSIAADSLLYNNSSRQLAAASIGSSLSFTGSSLSLNLGNGNLWTGLQQFYGAASSTLISANWAKFGATASSTFGTDGSLTMGGNIILNGKYLSGDGGNEGVYVDTSGNVGIGTTSPVTTLSVVGNQYLTGGLLVGGTAPANTNAGQIDIYHGTAGIVDFIDDSPTDFDGRIRYEHATRQMQLYTAQTQRMVIDSSGKVGIGTTSPGTTLHLKSSATDDNNGLLKLVSSNAAEYAGLTLWTGASSPNANSRNWQIANNYQIAGNLDIMRSTTNTGNPTTVVISIDKSGNVGIGTTSPETKLDVLDTNVTTGNGTNALSGSFGNLAIMTTNTQAAGVGGELAFGGQSGDTYNRTFAGIKGAKLNATSGDESGYLAMYTTINGSGMFERMRIDQAGNVGIGTTTPFSYNSFSKILSISGSAPAFTLDRGAGTAQWEIGQDTSNNLRIIRDGAVNVLTANTSGNVGIGTTNPNEGKVEVKGGSVCVDTDSNDTATSCIANESDERLKTNITSISASSSLDIINALNPVSFDWRATDPEVLSHYPLLGRYAGNTHSIGLIAQQVMPVLPEALSLETVGDSEVQYYQLDYTKFIPHLIGAVKELWAKVQDLGQKVAALFESVEEQNAKIQALEARVNQLEAQTGAAATSSGGGASTPAPEPEPDPIPEQGAEEEAVPDAEISEAISPAEESPSAEEIVSEAPENTQAEEGGEASASPPGASTEAVAGETETP